MTYTQTELQGAPLRFLSSDTTQKVLQTPIQAFGVFALHKIVFQGFDGFRSGTAAPASYDSNRAIGQRNRHFHPISYSV